MLNIAMLRLAVAALAASTVVGRSAPTKLVDHSLEVRRANTVRISQEKCSECVELQPFLKANRLAFVLFYERPTHGINSYKQAIIEGWHESCESLKFSRVACGKVDILNDKGYAEIFIDPKTVPAHIIFKDGEPQMMEKHHLEKVMKKPGDVEAMMWHLRDILRDETLEISSVVHSKKGLEKLTKKHSLVIVGFIGAAKKSKDVIENFQAIAQKLVLHNEVRSVLSSKGGEKARLMFVLAKGAEVERDVEHNSGSLAAFVAGHAIETTEQINMESDPKLLESNLIKVTEAGVARAKTYGLVKDDDPAPGVKSDEPAPSDKKARRRRRRSRTPSDKKEL
eukprot:TRINITY_DN13718_c0_g1_i1.p1 TRINITY_DN13718_c0_g1~~TRINITY_DN13718_c0_g1_i1.p1  ORF type:complete len:338 (-),score=78.71 TRINITY_DN13718_c0_g1_i1:174-1187(-)